MHVSYMIDYNDEPPQDYWSGNHVVEIREPGLHAPYEVEMGATITTEGTKGAIITTGPRTNEEIKKGTIRIST